MKKGKRVVLGVVCFLFLLCAGSLCASAAELPDLSLKHCMTVYPWKTGRVTVYETDTLSKKKEVIPYDMCKAVKVSGNAVQISYKVDGTTKKGWVRKEVFLADPDYEAKNAFVVSGFYMPGTPNSSEGYVYIPAGSSGMAVGEVDGKVQIYFKTGNRYRMGWISAWTYQTCVRGSAITRVQLLARGYYTISPKNLPDQYLTYDPSDGKFKLEEADGSAYQQFLLEHKGNNQYSITVRKGRKTLAVTQGAGANTTWQLERKGANFSLTETAQNVMLTYHTTGKLFAGKIKESNSRLWTLTKTTVTPSLKRVTVFSQYDPKWGDNTYYGGGAVRKTISGSGCGLLALTNAIYAMNGEFLDPNMLAEFSVSRGHYYYGQGTADTLYPDAGRELGEEYHFRHVGKVYSLKSVRRHLRKKGVAVALVPGHYIAIVAYRAKDDCYLVLDSAIYQKRPTTIYGDWIPASLLTEPGGTLQCEYFHLFSRRL